MKWIEKEFNAYIYMDDKENEQTGTFTYTNSATVNGNEGYSNGKRGAGRKKKLDQAVDVQKSVGNSGSVPSVEDQPVKKISPYSLRV